MINISNLHSGLKSKAKRIENASLSMALVLARTDGLTVEEAVEYVVEDTSPCDLLALSYAYSDSDIWNAFIKEANGEFKAAAAKKLHAIADKDEG